MQIGSKQNNVDPFIYNTETVRGPEFSAFSKHCCGVKMPDFILLTILHSFLSSGICEALVWSDISDPVPKLWQHNAFT